MPSFDAAIRDIYPLNRLSASGLAELSAGMALRNFPAGSFLFRCGDSPAEMVYVLSGQVELIDTFERLVLTLIVDQQVDPTPLPEFLPSLHDARAVRDTRVLAVNRRLLHRVLSKDQPRSPQATEASYNNAAVDGSWRESFLRARGYSRVPGPQLELALARMRPLPVRAQDVVIRQGEPADYFYVIAEGRCEVLQDLADVPEPVKVTEYGVGASLGEDALISGNPRNATVRMLSDGLLMRLPGEDFRALLKPWLARSTDIREAITLLARGARWLDVRMPSEFGGRSLPNSIRVPHPVVRARLFTADPALTYIVVCATQRDSPVIAYMLSKYGIDARFLSGGIDAIPPDFLG